MAQPHPSLPLGVVLPALEKTNSQLPLPTPAHLHQDCGVLSPTYRCRNGGSERGAVLSQGDLPGTWTHPDCEHQCSRWRWRWPWGPEAWPGAWHPTQVHVPLRKLSAGAGEGWGRARAALIFQGLEEGL